MLLRASAEVVTQHTWAGFGTVTSAGDDSCELVTGFESLDSLAMYLGMLGVDFEVREPPELAAHLRVVAARLTRAAESRLGRAGPARRSPAGQSSGPLTLPWPRPQPYARSARSLMTSRRSETIAARYSSQSGCSPAIAR